MKLSALLAILALLISFFSYTILLFYSSTLYHPCNVSYFGEIALAVTYRPKPGDKVKSPIKVSGCSRSFESTIHYKLVARDGTILAEGGKLSGGGVDGPALFYIEVPYKKEDARILNPALLTIEEDDPSGGEGFGPTRTVTPVLLN